MGKRGISHSGPRVAATEIDTAALLHRVRTSHNYDDRRKPADTPGWNSLKLVKDSRQCPCLHPALLHRETLGLWATRPIPSLSTR